MATGSSSHDDLTQLAGKLRSLVGIYEDEEEAAESEEAEELEAAEATLINFEQKVEGLDHMQSDINPAEYYEDILEIAELARKIVGTQLPLTKKVAESAVKFKKKGNDELAERKANNANTALVNMEFVLNVADDLCEDAERAAEMHESKRLSEEAEREHEELREDINVLKAKRQNFEEQLANHFQ